MNGTINRLRDDSGWTGCLERHFEDTDSPTALKLWFPLLCHQCRAAQRFDVVRNNARKCSEFVEEALLRMEDRRIDIPSAIKAAYMDVILLLPEVGAYARLSVNGQNAEAERTQDYARAVTAYKRYLIAIGSLCRIQ